MKRPKASRAAPVACWPRSLPSAVPSACHIRLTSKVTTSGWSTRLDAVEVAAQRHATELLALTKLNWNHSRLDGREPITTLAARSIGTILRHIPPGAPLGTATLSLYCDWSRVRRVDD